MDKYEYKLKLEQLKNLVADEEYAAAADLADTINWKKVRNVTTLCMVGDIYDHMDRYEDSRDVLLLAYDHSPIGRNIVYKLTELALKKGNINDAQVYYHEFEEIAPNDSKKYVLQYKLSCMKNDPIETKISILEELKGKEYMEEWAYELASLYAQAGMTDKCVAACDELILWFGDGEYVEKALELKMLYHPLSKAQEDKYLSFRIRREQAAAEEKRLEEARRKEAEEKARKEKEAAEAEKRKQDEAAEQEDQEDGKINAATLQQQLTDSMEQIMQAREPGELSETMVSVKKIAQEIPYLKLDHNSTSVLDEDKLKEQIDHSLKDDFEEFLADDSEPEPSIEVPTSPLVEDKKKEGQMSIAEVLAEWEKTKRAAEAAIAVAEKKQLELSKRKALKETQALLEKLREITPILESGLTPKELLEKEYMEHAQDSADEPDEFQMPDEADSTVKGVILNEDKETQEEDKAQPDQPDSRQQDEEVSETHSDLLEEIDRIAKASADVEKILSGEKENEHNSSEEEKEEDLPENADEQEKEETDISEDQYVEVMDQTENIEMSEEKEISSDQEEISENQEETSEENKEVPDKVAIPEDMIEPEPVQEGIRLTPEQRKLFSYFLPVPGMEEQICQVLMGTAARAQTITSLSGNIIIQGPEGSGKTVLATSLIKAIQLNGGDSSKKIGKISAEALNRKDFAALIPKLDGGYLIIEKAGMLRPKTVERMSKVMQGNTRGLVVVLEDTKAGIRRVMDSNYGFAKKFTEKINIPIFTIDELVDFAKSYAEEMECTIDEMGVLALYKRISNIQKLERATTLTEVREIVDEAIERAEKGGIKKAFGVLFSKKYNENDCLILREKDFE